MSKTTIRYGIKQKYWDKILSILHSVPGIEEIILFGSRAKGNYKPGSDIDLCLKGNQLNYDNFKKLNNELELLDLPWKVDLLHYESISEQAVIEHIDRVGIKLS